MNPPNVTNKMTGFSEKSSFAPMPMLASLIGAPAFSPKLKQALITPESNAMSKPFFKAKSFIAFLRSSSYMFFERKLPA